LFQAIVLIIACVCGYWYLNSQINGQIAAQEKANADAVQGGTEVEMKEEDEAEPLRNFTVAQLAEFNGQPADKETAVYVSLNGIVFDVTKGRNFYGPGGPYELFAGHECGIALAKMSFDATYLDDLAGCNNLNFGEKNELDGWIEKFQYYRCYPVLGRLVPNSLIPSDDHVVSKEELQRNDGNGEAPEGYGTPPIYLGAKGKVYDVSFGGTSFYGKGCPYNCFAGKDASRALAKMSFDVKNTENPCISDLDEKEMKILNDWVKTFEDRKNYPCVGRLE
jgi:membrane-associated progesterone receptor component